MQESGDLTELLRRAAAGDKEAEGELIPFVQAELRMRAVYFLRMEKPGHGMQPSDLVQDVYLKLLRGKPVDWQSRMHFFRVAARNMRWILVDYARKHRTTEAFGKRVELDPEILVQNKQCDQVLRLEDAMKALGRLFPRRAQVVEMHLYGGMTFTEIGTALGFDERTMKRDWQKAQAFLIGEVTDEDDDASAAAGGKD